MVMRIPKKIPASVIVRKGIDNTDNPSHWELILKIPPMIVAPLRLGLGGGGDGHRGDDRIHGDGEDSGERKVLAVWLAGKGFGCGCVPHAVCHIQLGLDLQPTSSFHPQRP